MEFKKSQTLAAMNYVVFNYPQAMQNGNESNNKIENGHLCNSQKL